MTRPHPAESRRAHHALFGGILAADVVLPGLPPLTDGGPSPSWVLHTRSRTTADAIAPAQCLGRTAVIATHSAALARAGWGRVLPIKGGRAAGPARQAQGA